MKRLAILIAAPKIRGSRVLPGTEVDVVNLKNWLHSNNGGAWEEDEIRTFTSPSYADLKPSLLDQRDCDYAFNAFAGHGYTVRAEYGNHDTVVCLRDGEDLRVKFLNPGNKRCTIVADCCRTLMVDIPPELIKEARSYHGKGFREFEERRRCRELFDSYLERPKKELNTFIRAVKIKRRPITILMGACSLSIY